MKAVPRPPKALAMIYYPWRKEPCPKAVIHEAEADGNGPRCGQKLSELSRWAPVRRAVSCKRCLSIGLETTRAVP